jgi:type IV pilus assembly protein PilC
MQLSTRDKFLFYAELAKLVRAGFGVDRAVALLESDAPNPGARRFAAAIRTGLATGRSVGESVERAGAGARGLEGAVLRAAETGGVLDQGLSLLADHFEHEDRVRRQVRVGLVYPAVLLHVAAFLPVLPALVTGQPAAAGVRGALLALLAAYALAGIVAVGGRALARASRDSSVADRFWSRVPLVGGVHRAASLHRWITVFRIHLLAGSTMSVGLDGAGRASGSARLRDLSARLAEEAEQGRSLGPAFRKEAALPAELSRSLAHAETVGDLEADLGRWAERYRDLADTRWRRLGIWLPNLVYAAVAGYVGWRIITTYIGIYAPVRELLERDW